MAAMLLSSTMFSVCMAGNRAQKTNLSKGGTSNCYIVSDAGRYEFRADVKGNSGIPVGGTPASAELLWEADGFGKHADGRLIKASSVVLDGSYVSFSTAVPFTDGNALIAVRDASGTILWSWHIWICKGFNPDATAQDYANSAGLVMDRNLGACSATVGEAKAAGLHYQWGRKDPFPPCTNNSAAAGNVISGKDNLAYSIANPSVFIYGDAWPFDWYCEDCENRNDTLWSSEKSVYDPCPAGWRVIDGDIGGVWCKAFGNTYYDWSYAGDWDEAGKGMNFAATYNKMGPGPVIWYPAAGSRDNLSGKLQGVGDHGYYWSATPAYTGASCLCFFYFNTTAPSCHLSRSYGLSVRCQRETGK